jgi:hypothetical protein
MDQIRHQAASSNHEVGRHHFRRNAKFSCARLALARAARAGGGEGRLGQIDHGGVANSIDCGDIACSHALSRGKWRAYERKGNALDSYMQQYQFSTVMTVNPSFTGPSPRTSYRSAIGLPAQHLDLGFRGRETHNFAPLGALLFER